MSYIIQFFIFRLVLWIDNRFVRAFNETCGEGKEACVEPLICIGKTLGYCLCSPLGTADHENKLLAFWTGDQCVQCPFGYSTSGTKCIRLIRDKNKQINWNRARTQCRENGGDLAVIRSEKEFTYLSGFLSNQNPQMDMSQRSPLNAKNFASVWIGAKLSNGKGAGMFDLVADGPPISTQSYYWCSQNSILGQEPNYSLLKETGERQGCLALAILPENVVCMHDWFCTWDTYALCEFHPPTPPPPISSTVDPSIEALETAKKSNNTLLYVGIFGVGLFILLASIGSYFICCKKKEEDINRKRSKDSGESDYSEN